MIDAKARAELAALIRSYMNEETTSFQLDADLGKFTDNAADKTVQAVAVSLWFHYDDFKDHTIVASKEEWDHLNRLLLLLESGGELETIDKGRTWHASQGVAAACLFTFVLIAFGVGWNETLFLVTIPLGVPSILIARFNARRERERMTAREEATSPFPSPGSLLRARRRVPSFSRDRYPQPLSKRRIRSPIVGMAMCAPAYTFWLMFSPLILLFQTLPDRDFETRVSFPEPPCHC